MPDREDWRANRIYIKIEHDGEEVLSLGFDRRDRRAQKIAVEVLKNTLKG